MRLRLTLVQDYVFLACALFSSDSSYLEQAGTRLGSILHCVSSIYLVVIFKVLSEIEIGLNTAAVDVACCCNPCLVECNCTTELSCLLPQSLTTIGSVVCVEVVLAGGPTPRLTSI